MVTAPSPASEPTAAPSSHCSTLEAAQRLGLAVRSIQMMVDRGELEAWKTPGGHRRISRASVEAWIASRQPGAGARVSEASADPAVPLAIPQPALQSRPRLLLIEDSVHYQNLVSMLIAQRFPQIELHIADDGVAGLAMCGGLNPDVLMIDILLPGIDGATLITSLRSHRQFANSRLIVVTALDEQQREPYAFALGGVPVVHKPRLVLDLPPLLERCLAAPGAVAGA